MGWFGKIILGIIVLGALAILADIITWIYEVAWIIPVILLFIILFIVWRRSIWRKKMKIRQLVKSALVDGKITFKEKQTIIKKAEKHRIDADEAEIYIEEFIYRQKKSNQ